MNRHVVQFSIGTLLAIAAIFVGCTVLLCVATSMHTDNAIHKMRQSDQPGVVFNRGPVGSTGSDLHLPIGEAKEQQLKAAYGEVNKSALNEVKQGWPFTFRSTTTYRSPSLSYRSTCRSCPQQAVQSNAYVTNGVTVSHPQIIHPSPVIVTPVQPTLVGPARPAPRLLPTATPTADSYEIDPSTCRGGSCALKRQIGSSQLSEVFQ